MISWLLTAGVGLLQWDSSLRTLMGDPTGRFLLALCFFVLAFLGVLLIIIPLLTRSIRLTFRRLVEGIEEIRRFGPTRQLSPDIDGEARDLIESLNQLLDELRGRIFALEKEHGSLKRLLNAPHDFALLLVSRKHRIRFVSRAGAQLLGYDAEELLDRSLEVILAEGGWNRLLQGLTREVSPGRGWSQRMDLRRKDGSVVPVRLSAAEISPREESFGFVISFHELSEVLTLERRLKESESRYRSLVEGLAEGVLVLEEGRIRTANPQASEILGVPVAELSDRPFKEWVGAEDLLLSLDHLDAVACTGRPAELDLRLHPRGSLLPQEVRVTFSRIHREGAPAILVTLRDETERRRSEDQVQASRSLLDATLESVSEGILVVGERLGQRSIILANRRAAALLGWQQEEILTWSEERFHREVGKLCRDARAAEELRKVGHREEKEPLTLELAGPRQEVLELMVGPMEDTGRGREGRIYCLQDLTQRRQTERTLRRQHRALMESREAQEKAMAELQRAQESLAARNRELERLNQELRTVDETRANLLTNVSHELQTPLVLIKGYTEMILKRKIGPITTEQEKGLNVALRNIDRLVEMIDNLLDFSRMERGEATLQLEEFPLWQLVDEVIELVRDRIAKKKISLTTQYDTDDLAVKADRSKMAQVLINLLTNAVKFNREGGQVTLEVRQGERGMLEVSIRDTGIGIPADQQDRIFERFYQVDSSSKRRHEGTGIGLAIVKDILKLHGCDITVSSREGEGSTFTFTVPKGRSPLPRPGRGGLTSPARRTGSQDVG